MGLTKEERAKRTKLAVRAAKDDGPEGDIARAAIERIDAKAAPVKRTKAKAEPVLTEDEKRQYALTTLGPLQQALAAATAAGDIASLKDVAAMASALKEGARARGMGIVSENQAAEVVVRSERAMGQVLIAMAEQGLRQKQGDTLVVNKGLTGSSAGQLPTLADLGFENKVTAGKFQTLARLSDEEFEALLAEKRQANERIARVDFLRAVTPVEPTQTKFGRKARRDVVEALHADDAIPEVAAWLAATEALIALTDALPTEELRSIGTAASNLVAWYNEQKGKRS